MIRPTHTFSALTLAVLASAALAVQDVQPADSAAAPVAGAFEPPRKYEQTRYSAGWERNPFAIPAAPKMAAPVESAFKDFAVKGAYGPKDNPTFSIVNTRTHERILLSLDKPKDGIELKSFTLGESRKDITVEVQKGSETATLTYAADYQAPAGNGAPAQQQMGRPGMPNMPGAIPRPGISTPLTTAASQQRLGIQPQMPNNATMSNRPTMPNAGASAPIVVGGGQGVANNANSVGTAIGASNGTTTTTDIPRRRTLIPQPTVSLGNGNTPQASTPNTPIGNPGDSNVAPPIVRPPPSIYLNGQNQQ